jgi:hypothetical protein
VSKPSNLPATITPGIAFTYNETEVAFDERRLVNVTQMWRAVGSPPNKRFADWRRRVGASFIRDLAKDRGVAIRHLIRVSRKKGTDPGATWAHWQVAVAYAKYLSNEFHRFVNDAFREWAEERADPGLKARRAVEGYRRQGKDDRWIADRLDGIVRRNSFTGALKDHGVDARDTRSARTRSIRRSSVTPPGRSSGSGAHPGSQPAPGTCSARWSSPRCGSPR